MKYTISWQKKRVACSFKYHAWHKAAKKLWITYSVTRKALGARKGGQRQRGFLSGAMGEPSATCSPMHAQAATASRLTATRVFGHRVGDAGLWLGNTLNSCIVFCTDLWSLQLSQFLSYHPCLFHPKHLCPTKLSACIQQRMTCISG